MLLDQFGVLHDGTQPYPGAVEAVEWLAQQGVKLLIISNSSRREHPVQCSYFIWIVLVYFSCFTHFPCAQPLFVPARSGRLCLVIQLPAR